MGPNWAKGQHSSLLLLPKFSNVIPKKLPNSSKGVPLVTVGGASQDSLTLTYGDAVRGSPRVYLIEGEGTNKNTMFALAGKEVSFDVDLSKMPCG